MPTGSTEDAATELRRGVLALGRRLRAQRASGGLTSLELSVLGHLNRHGQSTPGDLAAYDGIQPQSLTRTLARLEAGGLIGREPHSADGRRSLLAATDSGRAALRSEMAQRDTWLAAAMAAGLTHAEVELLRLSGNLMERLADSPAP